MLTRLSRLRLDHLYRLQLDRFSRVPLDHEDGFTLIELLVVIIIIGILAAIAIPVFLNQRQKGYDAGIKSDLDNAATAEETYLTDNNAYVAGTFTAASNPLSTAGFKFSNGSDYTNSTVTMTAKFMNSTGTASTTAATVAYCLSAVSASGTTWVYNSALGGLQPKTVTACPA
jgi:type IV pilus assembly protein PilA